MENKDSFEVLKRRKDFQKLKENGRRTRPNNWLLLSSAGNSVGTLRCGWTVPKKVGSAVVRNRIKRWCREWFRARAQSDQLIESDVNVIFLARDVSQDHFKRMKFREFSQAMNRAWPKLQQQDKVGKTS